MRVQEVILENGKRYILVDSDGVPVIPVVKYLKYLDVTGKAATHGRLIVVLKQYFLYLQETEKDYKHIRLEDLVEFVGWLRNPYESTKIMSLWPVQTLTFEHLMIPSNFFIFNIFKISISLSALLSVWQSIIL